MKNSANNFPSANLSGQPQKSSSNKSPQGKVLLVVTSSVGKPGETGGYICMAFISK